MSSTTQEGASRVRGPYAKSAKIRAQVVDVGIELFGEVGYRGATMKTIAERADMSLTGLLHHFPTKDHLLTAVLEERDRRAEQTRPTRDRGDRHSHEVESRVLQVLAQNLEHPELAELHCVLSAEATSPDHPAHTYFQQRYARLRKQLTEELEELVDAGRLRSPLAPRVLASSLLAFADGVQLQWLLDRDAIDPRSEIRFFLQALVVEA